MDFMSILTTILPTVGATLAVVAGFSTWLGKVWAARILEADRHKYANKIEELRARLQVETRHEIIVLENAFAVFKEKDLKSHHDKVEIYRSLYKPIFELIYELERLAVNAEAISIDKVLDFSRDRLKIHAELALVAPQDVLDAWDALIDFLIACLKKSMERKYNVSNYHNDLWIKFRELAFNLINKIRADIGLAQGEVGYRGNL